jgi:hypothetical protein
MTPSGYNGDHKVTASSAGSVSFASTATGFQLSAGTIVDESVSGTWAGNWNCVDTTNEADPVQQCIGGEFNTYAGSPTTDAHRNRVGVQITVKGVVGTHIGRSLFLSTDGLAVADRGIELQGTYGIGIDFTGATFATAPIMLAQGQKICLDGVTAGTCSRYIFVSGNVLYYGTPSGNNVSIDDAGNIYSSGNIGAAGTLNVAAYKVGGTNGFTGTKTAGSCVFTINGGIITNVTGC